MHTLRNLNKPTITYLLEQDNARRAAPLAILSHIRRVALDRIARFRLRLVVVEQRQAPSLNRFCEYLVSLGNFIASGPVICLPASTTPRWQQIKEQCDMLPDSPRSGWEAHGVAIAHAAAAL